jgi:hypothetical protein
MNGSLAGAGTSASAVRTPCGNDACGDLEAIDVFSALVGALAAEASLERAAAAAVPVLGVAERPASCCPGVARASVGEER